MKRSFCTYFNSSYMMYGLTMFRSLLETHTDFRLFVLCLDEPAYQALKEFDNHLTAIRLSDLEQFDPDLLKCKDTRSVIEYYFTLSPCYPLYLFARFPDLDMVTYLDADLFFYSSTEPLFEELGTKSMLIFEHDFSTDREISAASCGRFNVAFQIYRRNDACRKCLEWWREQCLEWCFDRHEDGKFADQKYLDEFPEILGDELVISKRHPGAALAPWNINNRSYAFKDGAMSVNGKPLIFCHYQGYKFISKNFVIWPYWNQQKIPKKVNRFLSERYYRENIKTLEIYRSAFGGRLSFPVFRTSKLRYMEWLFSWIPIESLRNFLKTLYLVLRPNHNLMFRGG